MSKFNAYNDESTWIIRKVKSKQVVARFRGKATANYFLGKLKNIHMEDLEIIKNVVPRKE